MRIVFTPDWFLGSDVCIDFFSFLILFTFFVFAYKSYKLSKNKNSLYLGVGFLLIAIGEASMILTKLVLYYDTTFTQSIGQMIITYHVVRSTDIFYNIGFFFHKFFTLLGLYILYRVVLKERSSRELLLVLYFLIVASIFGSLFYYIFHITTLILLVMILSAYSKIYKKNKMFNTKILIIGFTLLAFSHFIFAFSEIMSLIYVVGQIIQLISYIIFLCLIIVIWKNGKKKEQNRYNIRYAGSDTRKKRKD